FASADGRSTVNADEKRRVNARDLSASGCDLPVGVATCFCYVDPLAGGFRSCRAGGANGVCRGVGAVTTGRRGGQSARGAGFHGEIQSDRRVASEGATEFVNYGIDGAARSEPWSDRDG